VSINKLVLITIYVSCSVLIDRPVYAAGTVSSRRTAPTYVLYKWGRS